MGAMPLHRSNGLDPRQRDAMPQLRFEAPAGFVHAELAQRALVREVAL